MAANLNQSGYSMPIGVCDGENDEECLCGNYRDANPRGATYRNFTQHLGECNDYAEICCGFCSRECQVWGAAHVEAVPAIGGGAAAHVAAVPEVDIRSGPIGSCGGSNRVDCMCEEFKRQRNDGRTTVVTYNDFMKSMVNFVVNDDYSGFCCTQCSHVCNPTTPVVPAPIGGGAAAHVAVVPAHFGGAAEHDDRVFEKSMHTLRPDDHGTQREWETKQLRVQKDAEKDHKKNLILKVMMPLIGEFLSKKIPKKDLTFRDVSSVLDALNCIISDANGHNLSDLAVLTRDFEQSVSSTSQYDYAFESPQEKTIVVKTLHAFYDVVKS